MKNISLLDCTLRDGGYVNDWRFGRNNIINVFERLVDSNVDIIEVGFLDERRPFDKDRTIFPDTASADVIFGSLDKKKSLLVGMIDYGTCSLENLSLCKDTCLDGIRVIFKQSKMKPALKYCEEVKKLGYKVFAQLVSVTTYSDDDLRELIEIVNEVKPYGLSMVDTYGLLNPDNLLHIYKIIDKYLDEDIKIGFHAHNNLQLGYANALAFINYEGTHDIVVDGTLYGMGKSAGNDPIELVAMTLNDNYNKAYNIDSMLEAINESIMEIYKIKPWGYNIFFYLCSKNKCHPNYLTDIEKVGNLSITHVDKLLSTIEPEDKKLLYDKELSDSNIANYFDNAFNDKDTLFDLSEYIGDRPVLLLGPGKNIQLQSESVNEYIKKFNPLKISVNYIPPNFIPDCVFITNISRYKEMSADLKLNSASKIITIATSNVTSKNCEFDYVFNKKPLLIENSQYSDNSFLMLIKLMINAGLKSLKCAGFDGYSDKDNNYNNPTMEYSFVKNEALTLNKDVQNFISQNENKIDIDFITYSAYAEKEDINNAKI